MGAGCGKWFFQSIETGEKRIYLCNSARCIHQECQDRWARKRIAIANGLISKHGLYRFFTLTIDRSMDMWDAWNEIPAWWKIFRDKVRWYLKERKEKLKFFAVLEAHKDGYPHIHGFWNHYIPVKDISRMWSESAPGKMVWIEAIDDAKTAADYLGTEMGKYIGKKQSIDAAMTVKKGNRTFWRSKGMYTDYELDRKKNICDSKEWTLVKENYYGEEERKGSDMEGTCRPVPEESPGRSIPEVDSTTSEGEAMQRPGNMCRQTEQPEYRDKETPRSGSEDTEKEVTYEKVWSREHSLYTGQPETG